MKKTVIVGATPNSDRFAYRAAERLDRAGHEIIPLGIKTGEVFGKEIIKDKPSLEDVHTVTLYVSPKHQGEWIEYLLNLQPERIIFNPGTENPDFARKAQERGIQTLNACTLVMLASQSY